MYKAAHQLKIEWYDRAVDDLLLMIDTRDNKIEELREFHRNDIQNLMKDIKERDELIKTLKDKVRYLEQKGNDDASQA